MYIHDGRWGEWKGEYGMSHTFVPEVAESQSDIDNDAAVYKTPSESYTEPHASDEDQSESVDDEPYKEPREVTTIVQYVTTTTTGQLHKLRPRLMTRSSS